MAWFWANPDNRRWQSATLQRDVFGRVVLVTRYGGHVRRGFNIRTYAIDSRSALRRLLRELNGRRLRHAYTRSPLPPRQGFSFNTKSHNGRHR